MSSCWAARNRQASIEDVDYRVVEHLKNIAIACDDARLSENSSYGGGGSEGTELLVSALPYRKRAAVRTGPKGAGRRGRIMARLASSTRSLAVRRFAMSVARFVETTTFTCLTNGPLLFGVSAI